MANFSEVISCLKNGGMAFRQTWNENKEIMMQIPQCISKDIVPKMTSVQGVAKEKIGTVGNGEIEYHDQVIAITFGLDENKPAKATYYNPTWEDIFAKDWVLTQAPNSYKARMAEEYDELKDRVEKLSKFYGTTAFRMLPEEKQQLMKKQHSAMIMYLDALGARCLLEGI